MEWQPIDTIPQDGTRVELKREGFDYGRNGGTTTGVYDPVIGAILMADWLFVEPRKMLVSGTPTHWRPIAA